MNDYSSITKKIKELQGDLSNQDFAEICNVSEGLIRRVKKGARVSARSLEKIAMGCKVTLRDLFDGGQSTNTGEITTGHHHGDTIIGSTYTVSGSPGQGRENMEVTDQERELILLMRDYMSPAEQRGLLAELRSEAKRFEKT